MNNQEAKLILQAYRCGGQDASDPLFAEALEQVRRDPELQKWFEQENALDLRIQTSLQRAVPVPRELKSNLLALRKIVRPRPWRWFQPMKLAAAAAVLLLLGLGAFLFLPQKSGRLASFRETMARYYVQQQGHVAYESHDMVRIRQWLRDRGMETNFELPVALHSGPAQGCRVVGWNGQKATMLCFFLDGEHLDLFVMDRASLPGLLEGSAPQFAEANGLMTATWVKGDKVYLLTSGNKKFLRKLLQQT